MWLCTINTQCTGWTQKAKTVAKLNVPSLNNSIWPVKHNK